MFKKKVKKKSVNSIKAENKGKFERNCNFNKLLLACGYNKLFLQLETIDIVSKANNNIIIREKKYAQNKLEKIQIEALISKALSSHFILCKGLTTIDNKFNLQLAALKFQVIEGHGWSLIV